MAEKKTKKVEAEEPAQPEVVEVPEFTPAGPAPEKLRAHIEKLATTGIAAHDGKTQAEVELESAKLSKAEQERISKAESGTVDPNGGSY